MASASLFDLLALCIQPILFFVLLEIGFQFITIEHLPLEKINSDTKINILTVPETRVSGMDIIRYYIQMSPAIQAVQEHKANNKPFEVPTARPLKWLTEKPKWVKQWPLAKYKLQALE